ncbi:hypothetical protein QA644_10785 [Rhizobium sp. CC1099]|uniref:hypothetical protein n=1 Tax=Rhizobium sp. CC1099 TaxID=3039160 RepID=UPI0024B1FDBC|nr:hypothetical protein [Rhizobium sp. CC1099]WFU89479.1 hypothetical protein QA644_10785 [Rhizobium sp. CC1099]
MRSFRSMIFAGLAMIACATITMPAAASVPIDLGINAPPSALHDHQSAAVTDVAKRGQTLRGRCRGVRAMVDAANQKPEIARVQIAHACGTCQVRVA